jgi:hypothetical protein
MPQMPVIENKKVRSQIVPNSLSNFLNEGTWRRGLPAVDCLTFALTVLRFTSNYLSI